MVLKMCFNNYKIKSMLPVSYLSKNIKKNSENLKNILSLIRHNNSEKLNKAFELLKKANIYLTKLAVQSAELKEKKPELKNLYKEKEKVVMKINQTIERIVNRMFDNIKDVIKDLKKITFDADAILYKESRTLDKFISKISKLEDKELAGKLLNRINLVKQDIKTAARRLYEASRAELKSILEKYPIEEKQPISEEIKKAGIETESLQDALSHLKELQDIKKIEIDVLSVFPVIERYILKIKNLLYLLDEEVAERIKISIAKIDEFINNSKKAISDQAEEILEKIQIVEEIESKKNK